MSRWIWFKKKGFWTILIAAFLAVLVLVSITLYLKRDDVTRHFAQFLTDRVWKTFGLKIKYRRVDGNVFSGSMTFKEPEVWMPGPGEPTLIFKAERISFDYHLVDFFMEKFTGWVEIRLERPTFYAGVPFIPDRMSQKSVSLFSQLVRNVRKKTRLIIENGKIAWLGKEGVLSGISGKIQNQEFDLSVSLNHILIAGRDLSTRLSLTGKLLTRPGDAQQELVGRFKTEGTVVNWKPIAQESNARYILNRHTLRITASSFFGGLEVEGQIDYFGDLEIDLIIQSDHYQLSNLNGILRRSDRKKLSGESNIELFLSGSLLEPMIKGQILVKNTQMGGRPIKNIQLNFQGIYPDVQLSESRMVLPDGTTMNFANQTVRFQDLLSSKTYETLIAHMDQTDVSWGDWRLRRKSAAGSVSLEKELGEWMKLKYERYDRDEATLQTQDWPDEVELEYLLSDQNSLKLQLREDDEFIGVQKKLSF